MDKYYYSVGRVRALEARLVSAEQLARMSAAADFSSAFAVLSETSYAENLPQLKHPFDFEELAELERHSLKKLLDYLAPGNEIIQILLKKDNYLNAKILLKKGEVDTKNIDDKQLIEAINKAKAASSPQSIEMILDQSYYFQLKQILTQSSSSLIRNLIKHILDLKNIKILLRSPGTKTFLEPGSIDRDVLASLSGKGAPEIATSLNYTPYFPFITEGMEYFEKNKSIHLLEKLMDDYILQEFRKAKYFNSGIEPLVGFYLAKENEIKTVRFILIGKKNHVDSEQIRGRLRASYA